MITLKQNQRETDLKFLAIGVVISLFMAIAFITVVINKTQHTTYGDNYKSISELRNNLTYNIVLPSFVNSESDLTIGNIDGGVFTIANKNFRLCGCEYIDTFKNDDKYFRLCPLGFYEKIEDDRLYEVNSEDENFSLLRIRHGEDYTIFNYLYADIAYGCIVFERITDEKVLALVNLKADDITKLDIVSEEEMIEEKDTESNVNALQRLLDKNENIKNNGTIDDITYYAIGDQTVLIVATDNFNKYIETFKDTYEIALIDNEAWFYNIKLKDKFTEDNLNYYESFLLTIESMLEAYD